MKTTTIEKLIWVLIYGGLLAVGLGLFVRRTDDVLGHTLIVGGGIVTAIGVVLIYVRSRMKDGAPIAADKKAP